MNHLTETNTTYFGHLKLTVINALRLSIVPFILVLHGLFPFLFTTTSSGILKKVLYSFPSSNKDRILVRFNTKWQTDDKKRQWRVLVNGTETLASKVFIKAHVETIEEPVNNEQKFHFLVNGKVVWSGDEALIV